MATITVRGTGTAYGTPDEATVGLGVDSMRPVQAGELSVVAMVDVEFQLEQG